MISNWFEDEAPDFWSSFLSRSTVPFTPPTQSHNVVVLVQNAYYGTPVIGAKIKVYRWQDEVHARLALVKQTIEGDAQDFERLHNKFAEAVATTTVLECQKAATTIQNAARKAFASKASSAKRGRICLQIAQEYCERSGRSTMHFRDLLESYYLVSVIGWTIQKGRSIVGFGQTKTAENAILIPFLGLQTATAVSFAADKSSSEVLKIVEEFAKDANALEKVRLRIVASLPENEELVEIVGFPDAKSAEASIQRQEMMKKNYRHGGGKRGVGWSKASSTTLASATSVAGAMICSLDSDEFGEIRLALEPGQYVFEISAANYFGRSIPPFAVLNGMEEDEHGRAVQSALRGAKVSRCSAFLHPILHNVTIALEREEDGHRLRYENISITITNSKGGMLHHKTVTDENGVATVRIPSGYYECSATIPDFMSNQQMWVFGWEVIAPVFSALCTLCVLTVNPSLASP